MLTTHVYIYKNITAHQTGIYCRLTRCYSSVSIHRNRSDAHVKSGSLDRRQSLSYARRSDRYRRPMNPLNCFWVAYDHHYLLPLLLLLPVRTPRSSAVRPTKSLSYVTTSRLIVSSASASERSQGQSGMQVRSSYDRI